MSEFAESLWVHGSDVLRSEVHLRLSEDDCKVAAANLLASRANIFNAIARETREIPSMGHWEDFLRHKERYQHRKKPNGKGAPK
mmetsp:Transcript_41802/g.85193  ORF Transcript_41802/g.85193 Transcript_41802/m.85193 type:complete len:84 (-) Transcript_41802:488-739(-)